MHRSCTSTQLRLPLQIPTTALFTNVPGHWRTQRFGHKLRETKRIWISTYNRRRTHSET